MDEIPNGSIVTGATYPNEDEEVPSRVVRGPLHKRVVPNMGYTQYWIGREQVIPGTVRPAPPEDAVKMSDQPPGPPPHPGLKWKAETHRWVNPKTGNEHEHAAFPKHAITDHVLSSLAASGLPEHVKADYAASAAAVLAKMPALAHDRASKSLGKPTAFYGDTKSLGIGVTNSALTIPTITPEQRAKVERQQAAIKSGALVIGGALLSGGGGQLHLDGGMKAREGQVMAGAHGGTEQSAREVYAHEFMHAVNGPQKQISNSSRWMEAYTSEIGADASKGGEPRLTQYAHTNPDEGLSEFARLLYGGVVPLDRVEREFPISSKFFKEAKLWPV